MKIGDNVLQVFNEYDRVIQTLLIMFGMPHGIKKICPKCEHMRDTPLNEDTFRKMFEIHNIELPKQKEN